MPKIGKETIKNDGLADDDGWDSDSDVSWFMMPFFVIKAKITENAKDLDIVEDSQIIQWGESKPSKKYVSKELSPTLK